MAPAASVAATPVTPHKLREVSKATFPDGIRTSGQHPPLYDQLRQFGQFPSHISGATVWEAKDYVNNPERWIHRFSQDEVDEMSEAADSFSSSGTPLTGITKARRGLQVYQLRTSNHHRITFYYRKCPASLNLFEQSC